MAFKNYTYQEYTDILNNYSVDYTDTGLNTMISCNRVAKVDLRARLGILDGDALAVEYPIIINEQPELEAFSAAFRRLKNDCDIVPIIRIISSITDAIREYIYYINENDYHDCEYYNKRYDIAGVKPFRPGRKYSKIVNALFDMYNVNASTVNNYNKHLAVLMDTLQVKSTSYTLRISTALYDFLTQSTGHNWTSCYNLGDGCYRRGIGAYANDNTTFITKIFDSDGNFVRRRLYHLADNLLIPARIYPGGGRWRGVFNTVTDDILKRLGWNNTGYIDDYKIITGQNLGYIDIVSWDDYLGIYNTDERPTRSITVTRPATCIVCGETLERWDSEGICCDACECIECESCGHYHPVNEMYHFEDNWGNICYFCEDCVTTCDHCGELVPIDWAHTDINGVEICDDCYQEAFYCADCGAFVFDTDNYIVDNWGNTICEDCAENYTQCENCGEYFPSEDIIEYGLNYYCADCIEVIEREKKDTAQLAHDLDH